MKNATNSSPRTLAQLEEDRKAVLPWLWTATVAVMVASLVSGTELMTALGTHVAVALLFPISTDVGLIASLRGGGKLAHLGVRTRAVGALRWTSFLFCLALNCGQPVMEGKYVAAAFHAIMPVLMMVLAAFEDAYNGLISAEIHRLQRESAEQSQRDAQAAVVAHRIQTAPGVPWVAPHEGGYMGGPSGEPPAPPKGDGGIAVAPARKGAAKPKRAPRRPDAELLPIVKALVQQSPQGRKITRRDVEAACKVGPERAGRLLKAATATTQTDTSPDAAYL